MPLFKCPSSRCRLNSKAGNPILQLRASKFLKFQEVLFLVNECHLCECTDIKLVSKKSMFLQAKMQELAEHVPKGHIPRSMTVHLRGELTRKVPFLYLSLMLLLESICSTFRVSRSVA